MLKSIKVPLLILLVFLNLGASEIKENPPSEILIDDFSPVIDEAKKDATNAPHETVIFPADWKYRKKEALSTYAVVDEKNSHFLRAKSFQTGVQILKKLKVDTEDYPMLSWRWRVARYPGEEKNEKVKSDNAASVYAIFTSFLSHKAIKYTWSNYYKKGDIIDKGRMKVIVIRDQTDRKDKWILEERNVFDDFQKLFGKKPSKLTAVALMTDADNSDTYAEADYDDFKISVAKPTTEEPAKK